MKQPTVNILRNGKEDRKREWSVEDNPNFENPRKTMSLKVALVILVTSSEYYWLYCRVELLIGSDSMLLKQKKKIPWCLYSTFYIVKYVSFYRK